jgi:hypothetical protein
MTATSPSILGCFVRLLVETLNSASFVSHASVFRLATSGWIFVLSDISILFNTINQVSTMAILVNSEV